MSESVVVSESSLEAQQLEQSDTSAREGDRPKPVSPFDSVTSESHSSEPLSSEFAPASRLRLSASVSFYPDQLIVSQRGMEFAFQCDASLVSTLQRLFLMLDGTHTLVEVQAVFPQGSWGAIADILNTLNAQGLLDDATPVVTPVISATDEASLDTSPLNATEMLLQQMQHRLDSRLQENELWRSLAAQPLNPQVLYGFALELYYYLDQSAAFQSPLRDFQPSTALRHCFDDLCQAEGGQRAVLAQVLNSMGMDAGAIAHHLPLPETVALVNGLAFWSQSEPQFALLLQASLQTALAQTLAHLLEACQSADYGADFDMNFVRGLGQVTAMIQRLEDVMARFHAVCLDEIQLTPALQKRYSCQGHLFTELYDNWLGAIQRVYSDAPQLQCSVVDWAGDGISVERPRLRDGVLLRFREDELEVRGQGRGIAIALTPEEQPEMQQLLRCLQAGGFSREALAQAVPALAAQVDELLDTFQSQGWLTTAAEHRPLTGQQFYRELERFLSRLKQQFPPSPMLQRMLNGEITREQLIGYSLESYHVTHLCPRLLAPALGQWEGRATQDLLHDFFTSELKHDQLVENSLKAVGFGLDQVRTMQPLPMTFAVCSSLGVFARRHSLTFKSALMLFEEDDKTFHQLFEQCCQNLDLPAGFYRPILLHAHINEDGEHDQITKMLLAEVPYVSVEEQLLVQKNLAVLLMSMVQRTHEILNYYGNASSHIPRCFDGC